MTEPTHTFSRPNDQIAALRRFNRFYTQKIGVLEKGYLQSPYSLAEARVLYELAQSKVTTASQISASLGMDMGYLSRILAKLQAQQLIRRAQAEQDARQRIIQLTSKGQKAAEALDSRSQSQAGSWLAGLTGPQQAGIVQAMTQIQSALEHSPATNEPYIIRTADRAGDISWIVYRHAVLYSQEYGWHQAFEVLVLEIAASFLKNYDPASERCWVAERSGEIVGCVFLVKRSKRVAQLRLLLVEPAARGLGIGKRLVEQCLLFAREAGYKKIMLWTHDVLHAARKIYQKAGFKLTATESHENFGRRETSETWELELA